MKVKKERRDPLVSFFFLLRNRKKSSLKNLSIVNKNDLVFVFIPELTDFVCLICL